MVPLSATSAAFQMAHQEGEIVNQSRAREYRALFQLDWVKLLLLGNQGLLAVTGRHFPTTLGVFIGNVC